MREVFISLLVDAVRHGKCPVRTFENVKDTHYNAVPVPLAPQFPFQKPDNGFLHLLGRCPPGEILPQLVHAGWTL